MTGVQTCALPISLTLAGYGATVIVNYNGSAAKAEEVVNEITANGGMAESMQCSVSDFEKSKEMIDGIVKKYGRLDILVNNAGITKDNLIMKMSEDDFDAVIATNLKGAFNCIKHVSRQMLKQRGGRIINISSVYGVMGNAGQANYCASKAGIIGLTKSVARELGIIWGETGTGKELFAQSLHSHSSRARGPFVAQNCAAIPTTLLESTLFGTTRGSYTGAENRKGLLKQADGGTLFLDEVNSMDLSLQAKILKAIEEKRFRPVGGEQDVHRDVRIVSAMNVDPITAVREGLLRRDLFYRLGVVQLALPPLRKRPEDIPLLTDFYVEQYNRNMGRAISGVSELVRNALLAYEWPGNVRELRNEIGRAHV